MVATDSILNTIKHMLGVEPDYTHFDNDIINHINTVLGILSQIGVHKEPYSITGAKETWEDYLGDKMPQAHMVKDYIYNRVKLLFDPPLSSSVSEIMEKQIEELEWRLNVELDDTWEEADEQLDDSEGDGN